MSRSINFWIPMIVFQIAFGVTVFAITREVYMQPEVKATVTPTMVSQPWQIGDAASMPLPLGQAELSDPVVMAQQADEYFGARRYDLAADLYQQLINSGSADANVYNSLGLTLHYLGRSGEALQILNKGAAMDPGYQRIWLTLGFVNAQAGNLEEARSALRSAIDLGADNQIGQSAAEMLAQLPGS